MNWKTIIQELNDSGFTQRDIADRCNTSQSYISTLYNGQRKSPNWHLGDQLIRLHHEVCVVQSQEA